MDDIFKNRLSLILRAQLDMCINNVYNQINKGGSAVTGKDLIKLLEQSGWQLDSIKGSHHHFVHPHRKGKITVPLHKGDIPPGTLNQVLQQAGLK